MKTIIISQRVEYFEGVNEKRDCVDQNLISFFLEAGMIVYPIPNILFDVNSENKKFEILDKWFYNISPDGIILSGGESIGTDNMRDLTELRLLDLAFKNKLPLLGICRGMQIMSTWLGAKLHAVKGHCSSSHEIKGEYNCIVNSYHNFSLESCPENCIITAVSGDGEIEAIRHKNLPWEGWMWHPEREKVFPPIFLEKVKLLFKK